MTARIIHVTGARPNFPKASPVIRALDSFDVSQTLVHTGQHYDDRLSDIFFRQLNLRKPDVSLGIGSGSHAAQTASLMLALEEVFTSLAPDMIVVYGDVNSTLAAALVASKLGIPLAHVEAGLRSFDRSMPEEINRILTDSVSDLLLTTSPDANVHLGNEGIPAEKITLVGNPMIDTLMESEGNFDASQVMRDIGINNDATYFVATLHRPSNVDDPTELKKLVAALSKCTDFGPIILPMHPRGAEAFAKAGISGIGDLHVIEPQGYLEFMGLVKNAAAVITDSGGVQEETTILGVPCLTLRPNTERPITITHGTNRLVTAENLPATLSHQVKDKRLSTLTPPLWDGKASHRIAVTITRALGAA